MRIFWSWQSDHSGEISRHFVRDALELAVKALNDDLALDEPEREAFLDHDRKDVPGSPDLAATILEKIRGSDVFVGDVTPVGATPGQGKKLLNSNVAIELGYAMRALGDQRLLMVMNDVFGSRADLPFDLQHKAGPISYSLAPGSSKDEIHQKRRQLAGVLRSALKEMLGVVRNTPVPPFSKMPSLPDDPSRYFEPEDLLASLPTRDPGVREPLRPPPSALLYLRVIPTTSTILLKRAEAVSLIGDDSYRLYPLDRGRSIFGVEANKFGALVYDAEYSTRRITAAAQLFLSREIWAFNSYLLDPERMRSRLGFAAIPTRAVESVFATTLPYYLKFMEDKLGVAPPYLIEAGASGVEGFRLLMPSEYSDPLGPLQESNVSWHGSLTSRDASEIDKVLLQIFEHIFDAAAAVRPAGFHGFPGATPGVLSS